MPSSMSETVMRQYRCARHVEVCVCQTVLRTFFTRRNFPRGAEFLFIFSNYFHPRNHKTKKNSTPRGKFRLVENSYKPGFRLGGIFRAERNLSFSCDFSGGTIIGKVEQKFRSACKIPPNGKPA